MILALSPTDVSHALEDSVLPDPVKVEVIAPLRYVDAAAMVLEAQDDHTPLHYKEITGKAIAAGLIAPKGAKPELSLYAAISNEIKKQKDLGEPSRFFRAGKGYFGLAFWQPQGIRKYVEDHNRAVHEELLARIKAMPPDKFEDLVGDLLVDMGLDEVEVTSYTDSETTGCGGNKRSRRNFP